MKIKLIILILISQTALHLYQELFKIYKYSFHQQQLQLANTESPTSVANLISFKQIESSAIDYIWKLAFKSSNKDVSLAAIQFLNSHYVQVDTISNIENEVLFVNKCMGYLNEACLGLQAIENLKASECIEQYLSTIERGLLLIKNHLDSFQNRQSFQLRQWQLDDRNDDSSDCSFLSHLKILEQIRIGNNESFGSVFNEINNELNALTDKTEVRQASNKNR